MTIGVSEEHAALADAVHRAVADHTGGDHSADGPGGVVDAQPGFWGDLADQGLLGLHLAEEHGGGGYGAVELAVVLEQTGRGLLPGPYTPTVLTSLLLVSEGDGPLRDQLLPDLADGGSIGAVALTPGDLRVERTGAGVTLKGSVGPVLAGAAADLVVLPARREDGEVDWFCVPGDAVEAEELASLDPTRPVATLRLDGLAVGDDHHLPGLTAGTVRELAAVVFSAEAVGVAAWCLETAAEHARVREQFGRPIGAFQAVKHTCAEMLVRVEQARAAAWDAARAATDPDQRPLAAAVAAAVALEAAVDNAKDCIQVLGGIGFTWEHDAHRYLRRATTLRQLLGPTDDWDVTIADLALAGDRRRLGVDLPEDQAGPLRAEVRGFLAGIDGLDADDRRRRIADAGYLQPHWPAPWGRDAGPVEQLVIDEEFAAASVQRPDLVIGGWVLPTIIAHGTSAQQERFVTPTLHGELTWCQLFSEPEAGSDLAALRTRAERVDGGWRLTGQKVWTSLAREADYGLCLARTDPATAPDRSEAPKHDGITCFIVPMDADGIEIRPLTEIIGRAMFNEVFFSDVHVTDDLVVGEVDGGWPLARTTLANERVAMSSGPTMGRGVEGVLAALADHPRADDRTVRRRTGRLVREGQTLSLLGLRTTLRRLSGIEPGAASSVRKLVGMHHAQDCAEFALELCGPHGAVATGPAAAAVESFLQSRCLTIAGGTTEIQRNVIAERLLGLPRDP